MERAAQVIGVLARHGLVAAPHIAGAIARFGPLADAELVALGRSLSTGQLAGLRSLPDPLPVPETALAVHGAALDRMDPAHRRLLLVAALSTSDLGDVVLSAAATDPAVAIAPGISAFLDWRGGRFSFTSPASRAAVLTTAPAADVVAAHAALARVLRRRDDPGRAAWHLCRGRGEVDEPLRRRLLGFGEELLRAGSTHGALAVGRFLAEGGGAAGLGAHHLAGRAALALGQFDEALSRFAIVLQESAPPAMRVEAEAGRDAVQAYLDGLTGMSMADEVSVQARYLRTVAVTAADEAAVARVQEIVDAWGRDPDEVDAVHTAIMLSAVNARGPWPWSREPGPLSPLIDAYVRGQHVGFLLHTRDHVAAAAALRGCLPRLPMTHLAGGVTASALRILRDVAPALAESFAGALDALGPARALELQPPLPGTWPRLSQIARRDDTATAETSALRARVTTRQWEAAQLAARGKTNREIGEALGISARTVEVHLRRVFRAFEVRSRAELVAVMLRRDAT